MAVILERAKITLAFTNSWSTNIFLFVINALCMLMINSCDTLPYLILDNVIY